RATSRSSSSPTARRPSPGRPTTWTTSSSDRRADERARRAAELDWKPLPGPAAVTRAEHRTVAERGEHGAVRGAQPQQPGELVRARLPRAAEREQKTRARECALWAERFGTTATNSASSSPATDQP